MKLVEKIRRRRVRNLVSEHDKFKKALELIASGDWPDRTFSWVEAFASVTLERKRERTKRTTKLTYDPGDKPF